MRYRRRIEGKTDYKTRLRLLSSKKTRLVIRKTSKNIIAQIVDYGPKGDKVIITTTTSELVKKYKMEIPKKNIPSAYLLGLLLAKKALNKKIKETILDIGNNTNVKGNRLYAVLKGAIDGGLKIPHSDSVLPSEDRLKGKHIQDYVIKKKINYKFDVNRMEEYLNALKEKILKND